MPHPYCAQSDIEARIDRKTLASLTNDTPNATSPDLSVLTTIIEDADSRIDSDLGQSYDIPLSYVGSMTKQISAILTIYYAYQRRSTVMEIPKSWSDRYEKALVILQQIASLKMTLDGVTTISSKEADIVSPDKVFDFTNNDTNVSRY
jgi:phage gp36-like protein